MRVKQRKTLPSILSGHVNDDMAEDEGSFKGEFYDVRKV